MCLAQGPQRSDAGEARTQGPLVSSQALYHWATALSLTSNYFETGPVVYEMLILCMLDTFFKLFCCLMAIFKINHFEKIFQKHNQW